MTHLRNKFARGLCGILIFSIFVSLFSSALVPDKVYAKKGKSGTVYLIVADDYSTFKNLGVTDSSKAKIAIVSTADFFATNPPFLSSKNGSNLTSLLNKAAHAEIIYIPSSKEFFDSKTARDDNKAKTFGKQKATKAKTVMNLFQNVDKSGKYVTKIQLKDTKKSSESSVKKDNAYIDKMNETLKSNLSGASLLSSPSCIDSSESTQIKALVTLLQNKDATAFKFLTSDTSKMASDGSALYGGGTTSSNSSNFKDTASLLKALGVDSKYKNNIEAYAILLTNLGYSDAATAGILANMRAESGFNPLADEKGVNGGLFGFTPMTNFSNSKYNKNCTHKKGTAGGQSVCSDGTCQIEYMLGVLKSSIDSYSNRLSKADEYFKSVKGKTLNYSASAKAVWSSNYKLPDKIDSVKNLSEFKKSDDPISAASVFLICFERAAGTFVPCDINGKRSVQNNIVKGYKYTWLDFAIHEFDTKNGRLSYAEPIYSWLGGAALDGADKKSVDKAKEIAEDAAKKGYLTEEELSAWTKIVNEKYINYAEITRDNLTQSDLNSLSSWEQNVKYDDIENHGIFKYFRYIFMFIAIMMMVYSVLMYCCFWFDKVNPLFDISLLYILTFGKLAVAPTDEEVNYSVQDFFKNNKGKSKFVNHKYMLVVCLSMIFFSLMIITGSIYKIIFAIINWISNVFGF